MKNTKLEKGDRMRTNTEKYQFAHGRKPNGWGLWYFEITGTDGNGAWLTETLWSTGTLTAARKDVVKRFKSMSGRIKEVTEVTVLP